MSYFYGLLSVIGWTWAILFVAAVVPLRRRSLRRRNLASQPALDAQEVRP